MQTAYVLRGHLNAEGAIVLDEPAPLPAGPVLVTVVALTPAAADNGYMDDERAELWQTIEAIAALEGPMPPDDGLSAKDAEHILYGPGSGSRDVR